MAAGKHKDRFILNLYNLAIIGNLKVMEKYIFFKFKYSWISE